MSQSGAFDSLAPTYDDTFTNSPIGRFLRAEIHARLDLYFREGDHVLELGCGTGEDALYLAERGVHVTATDASERMLHIVRAKAADNHLISCSHLDLRELSTNDQQLSATSFDGAFSNFGAMNCLDDWRGIAAWLAVRMKPGGIVGLGVMSSMCLWEPLWHSLHGDWWTGTRRWRQNTTFQPDDTTTPISITYPTIRRLTRDFAPHFRRVHVQGVGLFLPPSDVFGAIEKRPRLMKRLMRLDARFTKYRQLALFADHYWIEFERI